MSTAPWYETQAMRLRRVAILAVVLLSLACATFLAQAAPAGCSLWHGSWGGDVDYPEPICSNLAFTNPYVVVTSCTSTYTTASWVADYGGGVQTWTATRTCAAEPPASSASEPAPTTSGTTTLVLPDYLSLSPEDGAQLAWLVVGVWAIAWAFRVLLNALPSVPRDDDD